MENKGKHVIKTYKKLAAKRLPLESLWQEAFDYSYPVRGQEFKSKGADPAARASAARTQQAKIYDSTSTDAVRLLASSLLAGLTPASMQWFSFDIPGVPDNLIPRDAKMWLQQSADTMFSAIHSSNYNSEAFELFIDTVIGGLAGIFVDMNEDKTYNFEFWSLSGMYVQDTMGKHKVDTVYRSVPYTVAEIETKFGKDAMTEDMKRVYEEDPYSDIQFNFIHAIRPRLNAGKQKRGKLKTNMPWESIYVCEKSGAVISEGGFQEFPVIVPRWFGIPGTDYALGPLNEAMPDVKTLNKVVEMILQNGEMAIAGTFVAKDDGVFNANTVVIGSRRVIMMADPNNIKPLTTSGNFNLAYQEVTRLQAQIKRIMMSDQLAPQEKGSMTATEVATRTQIVRQILSPALARLQSEFLEPLLTRCYGLAFRNGLLGTPPDSLMAFSFSPTYHSPIAKAQKFEVVQAMDQLEISLANSMNLDPNIGDLYDGEAAFMKRADLLGVPADVLRDEATVRKIRKDRATAQAQQAQAAQLPELAKAAKDIGNSGEVGQEMLGQIANQVS